MSNEDFIKNAALEVGFDACGIAKADSLLADSQIVTKWLNAGNNAEMHYLNRNLEKRYNPQLLVENTKSLVVVLLNYFPERKQKKEEPQIAKYAYSLDYHFVVKQQLNQLLAKIQEKLPCNGVAFCDSAPVLERRWAERAGLGWIGKSNLLINPNFGSFCLIGELLLDIDLQTDTPLKSRCGSCTKCVDACPSKALQTFSLDARKCISYLTIEKRSELTEEETQLCGKQLFGCDVCLDICPWNARAKAHLHSELQPKEDFFAIDWQNFSRSDFNRLFKHSPLQRAGYKKIANRLKIIQQSTSKQVNKQTD